MYPWPNLDTVPSLCNAVALLARAGYQVEVHTRIAAEYRPPSFDLPGVEVVLPRPRRDRQGIYRFLPRRLASPVAVLQRHLRHPYRCFIGVDPQGLVEAQALSRLTRVPLVYYSLELLLSSELASPRHIELKRREVELSRRAAFTIIQDEKRAALLAKDNGLPLSRFVLVPNAPLGPARRSPSRYWHERFGLPPDRRIVLHAGSLGEWTGADAIIASVRSWPENWSLVVHTRYDTECSSQVARLRELATDGRVLFSLKPASRKEYDLMVDGADLGVAFYVPVLGSTYTQDNIATIGLSSGKVAYYLRAGLPVIVNDASTLGELVRDEGCGRSVGKAEEIGSALQAIEEGYEQYSRRALEVFDRYLDFECAFAEVLRRLDSLDGSAR